MAEADRNVEETLMVSVRNEVRVLLKCEGRVRCCLAGELRIRSWYTLCGTRHNAGECM